MKNIKYEFSRDTRTGVDILSTLHQRMQCDFIPRMDMLYPRVKKIQLNAQLILSIFRQPLHVSGVSRPIIRRYNYMYTTIGTYFSY
jgi:hypothetical protein